MLNLQTHLCTTKLTACVKSGFDSWRRFHRDHTNSLSALKTRKKKRQKYFKCYAKAFINKKKDILWIFRTWLLKKDK